MPFCRLTAELWPEVTVKPKVTFLRHAQSHCPIAASYLGERCRQSPTYIGGLQPWRRLSSWATLQPQKRRGAAC